jgi:hypothetical protein
LFVDSSILFAGSSILFVDSSILFVDSSILLAGSSILLAGSSILLAGSSILLAGSSILFAGSSILFAGGSILFVIPEGNLLLPSSPLTRRHSGAARISEVAFASLHPLRLVVRPVLVPGAPHLAFEMWVYNRLPIVSFRISPTVSNYATLRKTRLCGQFDPRGL